MSSISFKKIEEHKATPVNKDYFLQWHGIAGSEEKFPKWKRGQTEEPLVGFQVGTVEIAGVELGGGLHKVIASAASKV